VDFKALQYAMLVTILVEVIGGVFFLLTACYIVEDKASVDRAIAGTSPFTALCSRRKLDFVDNNSKKTIFALFVCFYFLL